MATRTITDQQREARWPITMRGRLHNSRGARRSTAIIDLLSVGAKQGLEVLGTELRGVNDSDAGFRFDRSLHRAVVEHVLRANPSANQEA